MNGTSNLSKYLNNTPRRRQTRLSLATRVHQQQQDPEQQEQDGVPSQSAPALGHTQSLGPVTKRLRATMVPEHTNPGDPMKIFVPHLEQLSQSMLVLEQNFQHLAGIHKALGSFNHAFSTFLQGMTMNVQCISFPEVSASGGAEITGAATKDGLTNRTSYQAPTKVSFTRRQRQRQGK